MSHKFVYKSAAFMASSAELWYDEYFFIFLPLDWTGLQNYISERDRKRKRERERDGVDVVVVLSRRPGPCWPSSAGGWTVAGCWVTGADCSVVFWWRRWTDLTTSSSRSEIIILAGTAHLVVNNPRTKTSA